MNKPSQLVQLQESFYNYASPEDLISKLKLSLKLSNLIYNYWKLKRKVCWLDKALYSGIICCFRLVSA